MDDKKSIFNYVDKLRLSKKIHYPKIVDIEESESASQEESKM